MAGLLGLGNSLSTASTKRSGVGKGSSQHQPVELASRLLPKLLDDEFLEKFNTLNVLDFGSAYGPSLELFNQFSCRLCVLDVAESLLDWSRDLAKREEMPSSKQMEHELGAILAELRGVQFDLLFFWDTLNYLHPQALGAFANVLKRGVSADFRGHGYLLHKRGVEQKLRSLGLKDRTAIALRGETDVPLFAHNRKLINDSLAPDLLIDHGVLHGDGRLEYMMVNGRRPQRGARSARATREKSSREPVVSGRRVELTADSEESSAKNLIF